MSSPTDPLQKLVKEPPESGHGGWMYQTGWSYTQGGFYARLMRDYKKAIRSDGRRKVRDCMTEWGRTEQEAIDNLLERFKKRSVI